MKNKVLEEIAKPLGTRASRPHLIEKCGRDARVPSKTGGFAISSLLFLSLLTLLLTFCSCGGTAGSPENGESTAMPKEHYRSNMKPLDELTSAERIVILQNVFSPDTREGFYTRETRPSAVEIEFNGKKANAYPMRPVIDLFHKGCEGTIVVTKTDGVKAEFSADDFYGMYAALDLKSGAPPALYNPTTKSAVADFAHAVTSEGEAIYSVVGGSYHNVNELLACVGWKTDAAYRFVATDKFYLPAGPEATVTGELRGGLSGVVNGSFPDLIIAHGKINDVLYIERLAQ